MSMVMEVCVWRAHRECPSSFEIAISLGNESGCVWNDFQPLVLHSISAIQVIRTLRTEAVIL